MKKALLLITLLTGTIMLSGCDNAKKVSSEDLTHHNFELVKYNGQTIEPSKKLSIAFGETMLLNGHTVTGKMCNNFTGTVTLDDGVLKSSGLAMTRMLCGGDEQLNQLDQVISKLFTDGAQATLENNQLTLKDKDNELVYQLKDLM